jgi:hypothetical protein
MRNPMKMTHSVKALFVSAMLVAVCLPVLDADAQSPSQGLPEQRIEIFIRDYDFQFVMPTPIQPGLPTFLIIRNEGKVRHGFYSSMFFGILVQGEGEGVAAYGKGVEGFYVDPGKELVVRLNNQPAGRYPFGCDLHPSMKGEMFVMAIPAS